MESNGVKRLPVMRGGKLVGIVSRANLLQAVASLARDIPDPTAHDDHIRSRIVAAIEKNDWSPFGLNVVRDGIAHLSGVITEERSRQASIVAAENIAGVRKVHDHLCWVDSMSGMYVESPEDNEMAKEVAKPSKWQRPTSLVRWKPLSRIRLQRDGRGMPSSINQLIGQIKIGRAGGGTRDSAGGFELYAA